MKIAKQNIKIQYYDLFWYTLYKVDDVHYF